MPEVRDVARKLGVAARLVAKGLRRHLAGGEAVRFDPQGFRSALEPWALALRRGGLAQFAFVDLPAHRPPWCDTGLDFRSGDEVTWLAGGRVHLSRLLDIWVAPSFQLWGRIGDSGPVFRGTRDTHTFTATHDGRLWLASYFPGEWADPSGRLATSAKDYAHVSGGMSALVLRWSKGIAPRAVLGVEAPPAPLLARAEAERLASVGSPPTAWNHLWLLGPSEIYRPATGADGSPTICCHTHGDVGILQRDTPLALEPGTHLAWSWRVDELPIDLAEDTLPSHDYLSIAVEFDDGQDLTYYWSAALPAGTVYRCPLPTWAAKETHVVVRSGTRELGRWLDEERDLYEDYRRIIGGGARGILRVWIIANSLFQRGHGRCEYSRITLRGPRQAILVL
ncbi:MAG TPA: DUF3047 domain-containing protein [Steroidobacteraceae bacterium]|nr:DUF3047 domain-containing protein [Steroidobacteraceae bacterium]